MSRSEFLIGRRDFVLTSAVAGAIGALVPMIAANAETNSPHSAGAEPPAVPPSVGTSLRPFRFHATDESLTDLRRRIAATRWPEKETVPDVSQGVQLATMQKLARYWASEYDWRRFESRMNAFPQFVTEIDGLDIHFIHVSTHTINSTSSTSMA